MSTPMLMILKKYNVTQVIIKCFHVPPAVCLRTPRGTRTPGWWFTTPTIICPHLQSSSFNDCNELLLFDDMCRISFVSA